MRVSIEAPDIAGYPDGFLGFWSRVLPLPFVSQPITQSYQVHALAGTFVRLVELALIEYRLGCAKLREFWDTHNSINITAMNRSISHYETCVVSMHRAINAYRRLRRNRDADPLAVFMNQEKPAFATDPIADRVRDLRHEIAHLDERLAHGAIQRGQPFALKPDGPEAKDPSDPEVTVKHVDRLVIGDKEVLFMDVVSWLTEMCREAERMSRF